MSEATEDLIRQRNLYKGKYRALLKLASRVRNRLVKITDHLEDEGDRIYFGSTNDADLLRDLKDDADGWIWDAIDKTNRMLADPYAEIREQRARAEKAEAEAAELRKQLDDLQGTPAEGASATARPSQCEAPSGAAAPREDRKENPHGK